ncbi:SDR family NAD(P)-dependent oxidoreductase [uncultured Draconibacterium sp.]|uniref:SDR family NAD(P)-dependent oxidoreductase n=1 Tax=uncultured Draconibacterium sp. TaxID=1573823 RepID=UPI002AA70998|nr:SDR family NAD(P)-dependent oxidoreductase [uncultured Draconibacterium sp.]
MKCYICRKKITENTTHPNQTRMCHSCGTHNLEKRDELGSLKGYNAVVTGGRIKIGYETALKLLRSGAYVVVTTRFPVDAVVRYSNETDFKNWKNRLKIYKIDFRLTPYLYKFIEYLNQEISHLDILVNNAAQTIKRPYQYYQDLVEKELKLFSTLPVEIKQLICNNDELDFKKVQQTIDASLPIGQYTLKQDLTETTATYFPTGLLDEEGLQLDKRPKNSWISKAEDVSMVEMLEVQLINVTAPFILSSSLKELLKKSPHKYKFVLNVSAMEGKFNKKNKNCFHPHTNMAKASLNMFTRTSAQDYIKSGIVMNSIDTGWVTDENPHYLKQKNTKKGLTPPLTAKDGAARVCDPIFSIARTENVVFGKFLKDFQIVSW